VTVGIVSPPGSRQAAKREEGVRNRKHLSRICLSDPLHPSRPHLLLSTRIKSID
jgi:hypothetical protein